MINGVEEKKIIRSGTLEESTFSIEATPEAFEILSAGLYSDAQTAVLRELGCNAYDSHVAAGTQDIPFEVTLPNSWDATLKFRDFGTGLSEAEVDNTYRKYFKSSKTESNEFTGFLGLGSKSPFSLTSSFTVCSYLNGKKISYTLFKNEKGIPSITKLAEEDTKEKNGVEILIGTGRSSLYDWNRKATQVYRWFKVPPKITPILIYPKVEIQFEKGDYGDGWKVLKNIEIYAICGNVAYPIDFNLLDKKYLNRFGGLHLYFPIGSLDNAASREKLQYTKKTVGAIESKLDEVIKVACDTFDKELKGAKCYHDAMCIYNEKHSRLIKGQAKFNGVILVGNSSIGLGDFYYQCKTISNQSNGFRLKAYSYIHYNLKNKFYLNDMDRGGLSRFKEFIIKNPHDQSYIFEFAKEVKTAADGTKTIITKPTHTLKNLTATLGINESDIILTSTLPKITIIRGGRGKTEKVLKYKGTGSDSYSWEDTTVLTTDKINYVPIKRFKVIIKGKEYHSNCLIAIGKFLRDNKLIDGDIYGVRNSFSEKGRKNWINAMDLFMGNFEKLALKEFTELTSLHEGYNLSDCRYDIEHLKHKSITHKDLRDLLDDWEKTKKECEKTQEKLTNYRDCAIILDIKVDSKPKKLSLDDFYKKKPLLKCIDRGFWKDPEVISYINAI